jgi:hypothetical protein
MVFHPQNHIISMIGVQLLNKTKNSTPFSFATVKVDYYVYHYLDKNKLVIRVFNLIDDI